MLKKLFILGCNTNQVKYIKLINRNEWKIIGVDLNENAPGKIFCDKFYNVGYDNLSALIEIGKKEKFNKIDHVFTAASQFAHKGAAHFAEYFGIQYPSEKTIDLCLNKSLYYKFFQEKNIPIPKTLYIKNEKELRLKLADLKTGEFYLKSDFSKNPNYVYKFNSSNIPWDDFFWGKDRYLREYYILQEEIRGTSLRINIYGNSFNVFNFLTGEKTNLHNSLINSFKIIQTLKDFMSMLGIHKWLVKFDIILHEDGYVVLDIGLDPPSRMIKLAEENKINFHKYYTDQYLIDKISYPKFLN